MHVAVQIKQENPGAQKLIYGAFGLPFGLALIVICGGELFTANAAMLPAAIYEVGLSGSLHGTAFAAPHTSKATDNRRL